MAVATDQGVVSTLSINRDELRKSQPCDELVILRDPKGGEHAGKATAATFSSLAVVLDNGGVSVGDAIAVEYGGAWVPAIVHRAYRQPDEKWIVIVRWGH
jgi:hypothetical protein